MLNPSVNEDYFFEISGKRKRYKNEKRSDNSFNGLIDKTPVCYFPVRGKRKVINPNKSDDKINMGLFGVGTKKRVQGKEFGYENQKKINNQGGTGRKHYGVNNSSVKFKSIYKE